MSTKQVTNSLPATTATAENSQPSLPRESGGDQKSKVLVLSVPRNKGDLLTNFRPGNEDDEIEVSRAMAPVDCNLDPYVDKTITVVGVVLNMTQFESQEVEGEYIDKVYCAMVLDDGTIVGTTSDQPMRQLALAVNTKSPGPFNPPLLFEVRQHKSTPPKRPYFSLRRVSSKKVSAKKGA